MGQRCGHNSSRLLIQPGGVGRAACRTEPVGPLVPSAALTISTETPHPMTNALKPSTPRTESRAGRQTAETRASTKNTATTSRFCRVISRFTGSPHRHTTTAFRPP